MERSIVVKTPMRISFVGGGTDLPSFYKKFGGEVVSTTIDKYVTVEVDRAAGATHEHPIVRKCLDSVGVNPSTVAITIRSDLPSRSGLGGSSALTVGLINALTTYKRKIEGHDFGIVPKEYLARKACEIEINRLGNPIGKQDQYAAAYGSFNRFEFWTDNTVEVQPINTAYLSDFKHSLLLYDTGIRRDANSILSVQSKSASPEILFKMRSDVRSFLVCLQEGDIEAMGCLLDKAWRLKRSLAKKISSPEIDYFYQKALSAGAWGGKLLGAGGGGHFLFCVPLEKQLDVMEALENDMTRIPFKFEERGSHLCK